jgi:uncharacterized protein (TIGR02466 family)
MEEPRISGVFANPVVQKKFRDPTKVEQNKYEELFVCECSDNTGNLRSVDSYIFRNNPELSEIHDFCVNSINEMVKEVYKPINQLEFYITQSWLNITNTGAFHHEHVHPNSLISGAFYISTVKDDRIHFHSDKERDLFLEQFPTEDYQRFNSSMFWFGVNDQELAMFPSYLRHSVPKNETKQTRVSLAFNTWAKGSLGSELNLTELIME